ncbi:MAG: hypothetical protein M1829_006411 [Trizodia sp. TS-e1964]|nr:MAG: hypothetical protein M1829_006411 [Trizodia sp. TS-e1964]
MHLSIRIYLLVLLPGNGLTFPLPAIIGASNSQCSDYPSVDPVAEGLGTSRPISYSTADANPCPDKNFNPAAPLLLGTGLAGALYMGRKVLLGGARQQVPPVDGIETFATLADVERLGVERADTMALSHLNTVTAESAKGLQAAYLEALPAEALNMLPDSAVPGLQNGVRESLEQAIATPGSQINTRIVNLIETEGPESLSPWLLEIVQRVLPSLL